MRVQAAQLSQLQSAVEGSQQECRELLARLEEAAVLHERELQVRGLGGRGIGGYILGCHGEARKCARVCMQQGQKSGRHEAQHALAAPCAQAMAERHAGEAAAMEAEAAAARQELQHRAGVMAKAAAAAAEQRARADMAARWAPSSLAHCLIGSCQLVHCVHAAAALSFALSVFIPFLPASAFCVQAGRGGAGGGAGRQRRRRAVQPAARGTCGGAGRVQALPGPQGKLSLLFVI